MVMQDNELVLKTYILKNVERDKANCGQVTKTNETQFLLSVCSQKKVLLLPRKIEICHQHAYL